MRTFTRFLILGGDGVFGIHMAKYLLDNNLAERVVCIGRNLRKPEVYTLGVGEGDHRYKYYQTHMLHESDILVRILDEEKPSALSISLLSRMQLLGQILIAITPPMLSLWQELRS